MKGVKEKDNESYIFSSKFMTFLDKELQYRENLNRINELKEQKEKENKKNKIERLEREIESLRQEIDIKYKNLNTERLRFLNQYIFPSMANLVKFFEYLAEYPETRQLYESHIKELFGYITESEKKTYTKEIEVKDGKGNIKKVNKPYLTIYCKSSQGGNNIIRRLIGSLLTWDRDQDPNNFRLGLIQDIQQIIYDIITLLALEEFSESGINYTVDSQMRQAVSWTALYSLRYYKSDQAEEDNSKLPKRPIRF